MAGKKQTKKNITKSNLNNNKDNSLLDRDDIYNKWILRSWFSEDVDNGLIKKAFIELFLGLYDDLSEKFNM